MMKRWVSGIVVLIVSGCAANGSPDPGGQPELGAGSIQEAATSASSQTTVINSSTNPVITRSLSAATDSVSVTGTVTVGNGSLPVTVGNSSLAVTVGNSVNVGNFPATQAVTVSNFPATQAVSVANFPTTQAVSGSVAVSGAVSVSNLPATQVVSGTVSVGNIPSVGLTSSGNTVKLDPAAGPVATTDSAAVTSSWVGRSDCTIVAGESSCRGNDLSTPGGRALVVEEIACDSGGPASYARITTAANVGDAFFLSVPFQQAGPRLLADRLVRLYAVNGVVVEVLRDDTTLGASVSCYVSGHLI
jgi:hypothetical protein